MICQRIHMLLNPPARFRDLAYVYRRLQQNRMMQLHAATPRSVGFAQTRTLAIALRRARDVGRREALIHGETLRTQGPDQASTRQAEPGFVELHAELVER